MAGTATRELPDTASGVLSFARGRRAAADRAEADLLQAAVQWAVLHPAESLDAAESFRLRTGGECAVGLAGPGAPLVAEFCVAEFAAAVGLGTEAGKYYLGHALELRYRLPKLWGRVLAGDLAAWKARRVAEATISPRPEHRGRRVRRHPCRPGRTPDQARPADRLVEEAIGRFMPETAAQRRRDAADGRHFDIDHHRSSFSGTSIVHGELDLADALDLDDAIRGIAAGLADLGCEESLDVRRSLAAGELARRQLALDLAQGAGGFEARSARTSTTGASGKTVLHLHLSRAAIEGGDPVGRVENTRTPVTADQIREWCGHPDTHLTVKPVIDLDDHVHVDAYEVADRIAEVVALRDHACVFPWCTRPARTLNPMTTAATATTPSPSARTAESNRPAPASSHRCADDTTGSRPTAAGATRSSTPAPTSGPARTATSSSATTTAPSTSVPTVEPRTHPEIDPAPHPADPGGGIGMTTAGVTRWLLVQTATVPGTGRIPMWIRVVSLAPLGLFSAFITLLALSLTGWHLSDMSTTEQLRSDAGLLALVAVTGATSGVLLLVAITGRASGAVLVVGAALGCLPVAVRVLANLTDAF